MFDYQGPVFAANALAEFREDYSSQMPEAQNTKLRELLREISPVPKLMGGLEVLYALVAEDAMTNEAATAAALEAVGLVARAVGEGQYGGAETRDRAWDIVTWAAHQLDPVGAEPAQPEVKTEYSTVSASPTPPVAPSGPE